MLPEKPPPPVVTRVAAPLFEVIVPPSTNVPCVPPVLLSEPISWTLPLRSSVPPLLTTRAAPVAPRPTASVFVP